MPLHPVKAVTVSGLVTAAPGEVFAFIADTRNDPLWCPNVETVDLLEGNGLSVGSRFRFHQHLDRPGGQRIEFDVETEVVELETDSITWHVSDRYQEREIIMTVEPNGSGTLVTQTTKASFRKPPGLAKWAYPLIAKRTFKDQLKHLAEHFADAAR